MNTNIIFCIQPKMIESTFILAFSGGNIMFSIDFFTLNQGQNSKEVKMKVNLSGTD